MGTRQRAGVTHYRSRCGMMGVLRGLTGITIQAAAFGLLLIAPSPAWAETELGPVVLTGEAEIGGRTISGRFGSSKFEEYRDLEPGIFGNVHFLLEGKEGKYFYSGVAEKMGREDQHYEALIGRYGRYRLELGYDEIPHEFTRTARTLYVDQGNGVLTLPAGTQAAIGGTSAGLQAALNGVRFVPLDFRTRVGRVDFFYRPLFDLDVTTGYSIRDKDGNRAFGMGFGSPGNNFVNVAAPIEERTHEVTAGVEVAKDTWNIRFDYLGSFFENDLQSITVDNPLVAVDTAAAGSSRGRTALGPDNSAHTFSLSGASTLPLDFPARLAGTFSYGLRFQDEDFLPHTINTAIVSPLLALPKNSLDGEVDTILLNLVATGRPHRDINVTTRYRFYDLNNKTDVVTLPAHVVNDRSLVVEERFTVPNDYSKHNVTLDVSYRVARPATLKVGYGWERWNRSDDREVTRTDEHIAKAAVDYRPAMWALFRVGYNFGIRRGSDYNTFAHLAHTVPEADVDAAIPTSQSPLLRKFDEADRTRHLMNVLAQLTPHEDVTLALTGGYSKADYDDTTLGLTDDERWNAGFDASYSPLEWLTLSTWYTYENIKFQQRSRWRPRNFVPPIVVVDDPLNDWESTSEDKIHTAGVGAGIVLIPKLLDASLSYVVEAAKAETRAQGVPGLTAAPPPTTSGDGGNAVDYPDITDMLHTFVAAIRYHFLEHLTAKLEYHFEDFTQNNFKTDGLDPFMPFSNVNGSGAISPSTDVFLGERVEGYNAHIVALSLIYRF